MKEVVRDLPLAGITVLDLSQFLAGPSCCARLGELGADVIKVERHPLGDPSRMMVVAPGLESDGDSLIFHAINRGKRSIVLDLKSEQGLATVKELITSADVLVESYRPGVMERLGLGPDDVRALNPQVVYGRVTGYGATGPWSSRPGQDLLAQALSGMCWLQGRQGDAPTPIGFSIVDAAAGTSLTQGVLAALLRRERDAGAGGLVEVSLLEAAVDLQFEVLTLHLNQQEFTAVPRSAVSPAHPYLAAPYGIYETSDGWIAIAMAAVDVLGDVLQDPTLAAMHDPATWWRDRDDVKTRVAAAIRDLKTQSTVDLLLENGIWTAEVLDWTELVHHPAFESMNLLQALERPSGAVVTTTRCPFRIDGKVLAATGPAPRLNSSRLEEV